MRGLWFLWAVVITIVVAILLVSVFYPGTKIRIHLGGKPTPTPQIILKTALDGPTFTGKAKPKQLNWTSLDGQPLNLWSLQAIDVTAEYKGQAISVGVLDTGVQADLPDLAGRVFWGGDFSGSHTGALHDGFGHGTHVSGILAGKTVGVCNDCQIKMYKVFADNSPSATDYVVAQGIEAAVKAHVQIISMSLGGPDYDANTAAAVSWAVANGVIVVAAAGNDGTWDTNSYPADYPGVVSVGATDANFLTTWWSNKSSYVTLAAPGSNIYSDYPNYPTGIEKEYQSIGYEGYMRGHAVLSGTSMATPLVAGALGVLMGEGVSPQNALTALEKTAKNNRQGREQIGYGIIDLGAAFIYAAGQNWTFQWHPSNTLLYPNPPTLTPPTPMYPPHHKVYVSNGRGGIL